jgi:hypothetical protein
MSDSLADLFLAANAAANAGASNRPVVLPGEDAAAVAAVAQLRSAAASGRAASPAQLCAALAAAHRATGDAAHARAMRRAAQMRQAIDAELAQD